MVIQHNQLAMNANRMLGITNKKQASTTEKLPSGYRVNRAADDAAGLAIAEKMRRQIRGLTLRQMHRMVFPWCRLRMEPWQRYMKCFTGEQNSVKAANGTLTDDDRSYIRQEISKLKKEIDSISEKTTFNEIQVLKGKDVPVSEEDEDVVVTGEMPAWVKMGSQGKLSESYTTTETYD